ncbi:unnamed protein product, partial [Rotaria magnacalcarata]
ITGEYGSLPYEDLQLGLTAALKRYSYIDETRAVAFPYDSNRKKTGGKPTVHRSFSEHDAGGFTPYENPHAYKKFNPINHIVNWSQPMSIIHGELDYRVPDIQGIGAFIALQRRGIPSRML